MLSLKTWIGTMGLLFVETFVLFVVWNLLIPNPTYIHILETVLPGFRWLSEWTMLLGIFESFFYGAYLAGSFVLIHNFLHRRHERQAAARPRNMKVA